MDSIAPPFSERALPATLRMLQGLPLGLAILDSSGTFLRSNDAFRETVGCDPTSFGLAALAIEEDRAHLLASVRAVIDGQFNPPECRVRLAARPDETISLNLALAPPGWGFAVLVAVRDIREQLKLERQVAQVTKMQAVGQLAGGIAHDFNNILTAVLGLCDQLLEGRAPDDPDYDDIDQIRQNGNRAADLVRQLLAFARQQTLRPQLLAVDGVIAGVEPLLRRLLGSAIPLTIAPGRDLGMVRVDPGQLEQVIVNLVVNARDAMPDGGSVTIASHGVAAADVRALGHEIMPVADYIAIVVTDTGTGIAPEISAKIFEPFFTTKAIGQGTGLGLSTVYGIVKQTGGFIFVGAGAERGTSFTIYFPALPRPAEAAEPAAPAPSGGEVLTGTVLLVEDDRAVRLVVERALKSLGLAVVSAVDGVAGLEALDSAGASIDILVSDVVMPGIDGVALLEAARQRFPSLPAVLMSGYAEPPQRRAVGRTGVVFLAKPFAIRDLLEAVRSAMVR